ncbi:hypothetical protein CA265_18150 [Sphingobacteriaceae bacterium GW460-11-11-14-LB5]|nr:hypothetical protein CA265_18150 [Sphingobacteriaceae bacterium GW460-11-11-14-LB5]
MNYAQLESYLSQPRLNRFLRATGNSKVKAQKLYRINLRVCQAFYPIMNLFETFLRNAVYNTIAAHFADNDWIINQKSGFMSHLSLAPSRYYLKGQVDKGEVEIRRKRNVVTASRLIAEQTFGFWTAFFDNHHYILVGGAPLNAFIHKPQNINRSALAAKLLRIRTLRNRIYHNEPICFSGNTVEFSLARKVLDDIHDILEWISPDLKSYTDSFNSIVAKIDQVNNL